MSLCAYRGVCPTCRHDHGLDGKQLPKIINSFVDQLREVEQQRDELLAALEQIGSMAVFLQFIAIGDKLTGDTKNEFEKHKVLGSFRKVKEIADAAIAKAKP